MHKISWLFRNWNFRNCSRWLRGHEWSVIETETIAIPNQGNAVDFEKEPVRELGLHLQEIDGCYAIEKNQLDDYIDNRIRIAFKNAEIKDKNAR